MVVGSARRISLSSHGLQLGISRHTPYLQYNLHLKLKQLPSDKPHILMYVLARKQIVGQRHLRARSLSWMSAEAASATCTPRPLLVHYLSSVMIHHLWNHMKDIHWEIGRYHIPPQNWRQCIHVLVPNQVAFRSVY